LEVEHHEGRVVEGEGTAGVLVDRSMAMLTCWGRLGADQAEVAIEGSVSLDDLLQAVLGD
jgi:hypothetical protein